MINVSVTDDFDIADKMPQLQENIVSLAGSKLESLVSKNSPYDTGRLQGSWRKKGKGTTVEIVTSAEYAKFVNDGHMTRHGKNKSAHFVKGKKFIEKSIDQLESHMPDIAQQALDKL